MLRSDCLSSILHSGYQTSAHLTINFSVLWLFPYSSFVKLFWLYTVVPYLTKKSRVKVSSGMEGTGWSWSFSKSFSWWNDHCSESYEMRNLYQLPKLIYQTLPLRKMSPETDAYNLDWVKLQWDLEEHWVLDTLVFWSMCSLF